MSGELTDYEKKIEEKGHRIKRDSHGFIDFDTFEEGSSCCGVICEKCACCWCVVCEEPVFECEEKEAQP